jgi:ABC-type glycerol-3-phosphate transport system substrate-binding protein
MPVVIGKQWRRTMSVHTVTRRHHLRTLGGAAGALAQAACAGPDAAAPRPAAAGKVLFWQESITPEFQQFWQAAEAAFNQVQPRIELSFDTTPLAQGQTQEQKLLAALASGNAWDAWERIPAPSYMQGLVDQKALLAMDEHYARFPNLKRIHGWARSRSKLFGKTWGVPNEVEFITAFYNRPVFE